MKKKVVKNSFNFIMKKVHNQIEDYIRSRYVAVLYDCGNKDENIEIIDCKKLNGVDIFIDIVTTNSDNNIYEYNRVIGKYNYRTLYIDSFGMSKFLKGFKKKSDYIDRCIDRFIISEKAKELIDNSIDLMENELKMMKEKLKKVKKELQELKEER